MDPALGFPSYDESLALHLRLVLLDPTGPADVCAAYLGPLVGWLETHFRTVDPHLRQTAAHEALIAYLREPQSYDPGRGDLGRYLRMAARSDLLNLLARDKRQREHFLPWSAVEDDAQGRYLSGKEPEPSAALEHHEELEQWQVFLRSVAEGFTPEERKVLELIEAGERRCAAFAAALGIEHLPAGDQERKVKRMKDRIIKRLERRSKDV